MDTLPFLEEFVAMRGHFGQQPPHIRPADGGAENDLRRAGGAEEIDFRLSCPGDVDVRRLMVECLDDEPEAERAMDHDHGEE
jgi:hypothetical protein